MGVLNRVVIDFWTEEELSERRKEIMAREVSDNLHIMAEAEDGVDQKFEHKFFHIHEHDSTRDTSCRFCISFADDRRNRRNLDPNN